MKRENRLTIALCGLVLLAAALPALAQPRGHGKRGGGPGEMGAHRLEHIAQRLELSDGQREELKELFVARFETGAEGRRGIGEARQALEDRISADAFDEAAIRKAAGVLAALEADGAVDRARQAQRMRAILTPEQLVKLEEMRGERRRGGRGSRGRGFGGPPPAGE